MSGALGVWITGPSRSGTSLTAGLFATHGVFFGQCREGDAFNRKGYWEHPLLVDRVESGEWKGWPEDWWQRLRAEGWDGETVWGAKRGPQAWRWAFALEPSVIVMTLRPRAQILQSRMRWGRGRQTDRALAKAKRLLAKIERNARCPVVRVNTDQLVKGDYRRILPAFDVLGLRFEPSMANYWIDPTLWCGGKGAA